MRTQEQETGPVPPAIAAEQSRLKRAVSRALWTLFIPIELLYLVWDAVAANILKSQRVSRRLGKSCQWLFNIEGYPFCIPSLKYRHPRLFRCVCRDILAGERSPEGFCLCSGVPRFPRIYALRSLLVLLAFVTLLGAGVTAGLLHARGILMNQQMTVDLRRSKALEIAEVAAEKMEQERWEEAREHLMHALEMDPQSVRALLLLADYFEHADAPVSAAKYLESADRADPKNLEVLERLATIYGHLNMPATAREYAERAIDISEESAVAHRILALCELTDQRFEKARRHLDRANALGPPTPLANLVAGKLAFLRRDMDAARKAYGAVIESDAPEWANKARLDLASIHMRLGEPEKAEKLLQAVIEATRAALQKPDMALMALDAETRLVKLYVLGGNRDLAVVTAEKVVERHPHELLARIRLASVFLNLNMLDQALSFAQAGLRTSPRNLELNLIAAECNLQRGYGKVAEGYCEAALREAPDNVRAHLLLAQAEWQQGRRQEAIDRLEKLGKREEATEEVWRQLSQVHALTGHPERAVAALRTAVQRKPESASLHALLGSALQKSGKTAEARAAMERAIELDDTLHVAHLVLGVIAEDEGRFAAAMEHYRRAIKNGGRQAWRAGNNLALLLLRREGDPVEALRLAMQAVNHSNGRVETLDTAAQALAANGELQKAYALMQEAVRLFPKNPYICYTTARLAADLGEPLIARAHLRRAIEHGKGLPVEKEARELLERLDE